MSKCPYNNTIECDKNFQITELMRQQNLILRAGGFWFNATKSGCRVKSSMCGRLAAQRQH